MQFTNLSLEEFYCEQNPFLEDAPVQSVQEDEVLTLKVSIFVQQLELYTVFYGLLLLTN